MQRCVGDFVHATCRAITACRHWQQVLRLLQVASTSLLACESLSDINADADGDISQDVAATQESLAQVIARLGATQLAVQQAFYAAAFQPLSATLLEGKRC